MPPTQRGRHHDHFAPPQRLDRSPVELVRSAFDALNRGDLDACTRLMTEDFATNIAGLPFRM
ncbi:hypothetical protein ABTY98_17720 [Streptomyces sp. NPDC096040]|uniref:hypothetical protein n=1 Tax=Streptomyces sp. NPDC096040 TaxID=3155541 RepID=UPI00331C8AC1